MATIDRTRFRVYRGLDRDIQDIALTDGYLYFATDTGRIYLDYHGERVTMGGNGASLFYAYQSEVGQDDNDWYVILRNHLSESSAEVKLDDLIINVDGSFYKVIGFNGNDDLLCSRIAVSGSGGGGGTGPVTYEDLTLTIDSNTLNRGQTLIQGQDYYVSILGTSTVDSRVSFFVTFTGANGYYYERTYMADSGEPFLLNVNFLPLNNNITMTVQVSSDNTRMDRLPSRQVSNIRVVEMDIKKVASFNTSSVRTGQADVLYKLYGDPTLNETLRVWIDGLEQPELEESVRVTSENKSIKIGPLPHGVHTIELAVSTTIQDVVLTSNKIAYELAWAEVGNTTPIIWTGEYPDTVIQYEPFTVNYQVYDPVASGNGRDDYFSVYIYKGGALISEISRKYTAGEWLTLDLTESYTITEGRTTEVNNYTIMCGTTQKLITFTVTTEGSRDLSIAQKNALVFNLSATGRSNDEIAANRTVWASGAYGATFNNFNWYNNGWKNDNDGFGSYLSVANGASLSIPFRNFNANPVEDFLFNDGIHDYTIEARFRIRNVQEYSTLVSTNPWYYVMVNGVKSEIGVPIQQIKAEGLTIAVDDDGNWLMDQKNSEKIIKTEQGVCLKILGNNPAYGLCIGTQEAYFRSPEGVTSVRYKEDEIINFSVVVSTADKLASIYLNGILSGSLNLGNDSNFTIGDIITVNSKYCDIDIYKIRFFSVGLSMPEVIHNYISDIHNLTLYDQNQLTKDDNPTLLSYKKLTEYNARMLAEGNIDALTMPYAVIEVIDNVAGMNDPNKGSHTTTDDLLPWKKGNNRYCAITFVNPTLDALYNNGTIDASTYIKHAPSYRCVGADINVQGTSSQGYPRRNYKTKHKSAVGKKDAAKQVHEDWGWFYTNEQFIEDSGKTTMKKWQEDNPNYGTNKYTWKIDYMESSGSYNTGFANLVGNNIYSKHPLDFYNINGLNTTGLRTSVYGFPCLVFHKHSKPSDVAKIGTPLEDEIYEYIGRYNINQDKGSDELYGFAVEVEQPYVDAPWDEEVKNSDGTTTIVHHAHPYISQIAECWEMTDNQGTWTSFSYPTSAQEAKFGTYTIDSYENGQLKENPRLEVIRHYECRYHKDADTIEIIASDEKPYDLATAIEEGLTEIDTIPKMNSYIRDRWANWERFVTWCDSTDRTKADPERDIESITYEINTATLPDMTGVTINTVDDKYYATFTKDTATYRLQKFKSEFNKHLNLEYCAVYFVMTELLLCYDSRGKNLMMASYGPMEVGGDYIWFPIFYDIDTQLGLNNIGATLWDYDCDATLEQAFSTPSSVLWVNFLACFEDNIRNKYAQLRSESKLTETTINGAYLCDPNVFNSYAMRGLRPIIAIGLDEYYKYVAPSKTGYRDTAGALVYDNNSYAYAVNGDRMLSRELLLRNRLNYMDSYWAAGDYVSTTAIQTGVRIRANANNSATSDTYLDSGKLNALPATAWTGETLAAYPVAYYDATPEFEITPFLSQYVFTYNDKQASGAPVKYQGQPVLTAVSDSVSDGYKATPGFPEQIIYIPAADYISSLGDLSLKYLSQFTLMGGKRFLDLDIGSDAPNYFNNLLGAGTGQFNINDSAYIINEGQTVLNPGRKTLLKRINLTNVTKLQEYLDVSGSEKLQELRALGSQIQYVVFAEGAPLDCIHLPRTVTRIDLVEATGLTRILETKPVVWGQNRDTYTGLYIEDLTDNDGTFFRTDDQGNRINNAIERINIVGGVLGYDSYKLLKKAIAIKDDENLDGLRLRINLEDVKWSPYLEVEPDSPYNSNTTYYYLTEHSTFTNYTYSNGAQWSNDTLNGKVFTYNNNPDRVVIDSTEMLDHFLNDYDLAISNGTNRSHYTNLTSTLGYPVLTGTIYINNTSGPALKEADITDKYGAVWNKLKIYAYNVEEAYVAKFVQRLDSGKDKELDVIRYTKEGTVHPTMTEVIPVRANSDFEGWTLDPQYAFGTKEQMETWRNNGYVLNTVEAIEALTFDAQHDVYTFYAVFSITSYHISFLDPYDDHIIAEYDADYGTYLYDPAIIPTTNKPDIEIDELYKFIGWSLEAENCFPADPKKFRALQLSSIVSQNNDRQFYAAFVKADVHDNPLDSKYLEAVPGMNTYTDAGGDSSFNLSSAIGIRPKTGVILSGKITIPATFQGKPVYYIEGFNYNHRITHVFFEDHGENIRWIGSGAFKAEGATYAQRLGSTLEYVEWPQNVRVIADSAFYCCTWLKLNDLNGNSLANMAHLYSIGENAFRQVANGAEDSLKFTNDTMILPGSLRTIGATAFFNLSNESQDNGIAFGHPYNSRLHWEEHPISIQFGAAGDPSQLELSPPPAEANAGSFDINLSGTEYQVKSAIIYVDSTRLIAVEQGTNNNPSFVNWVNSNAFDGTRSAGPISASVVAT